MGDFSGACLVGQWYRARWEIELFLRVRNQGCQIERWRVGTDPRLLNALALDPLSAWRLPTITMRGGAYPDASCEVGFAPREWQTIEYEAVPQPTPRPAAVARRDGPGLSAPGGLLGPRGGRRAGP